MIAVVVLTHDRVHLLQQCVDNVLARASDRVSEILIWDNASSDGTREYLATLTDPRIRVVHHERNIGQNAYAEAVQLTSAPYVIELDDDMIDSPPDWDRSLLEAYEALPKIGFLAANLADNPHDTASRVMYDQRPEAYHTEIVAGVKLKRGPVGGGCALTSRELMERVGGFRQQENEVFWLEDAAYIEDIARLGYEAAYLEDVQLTHAGGAYYAKPTAEKHAYWKAYWLREIRKNRVKRALLLIPGVRPLNERHGWFRLAEVPKFPRGWRRYAG
jgi:GT2 family glycosyltransferase